jgi:ABC-type transport system substrate-binding protein
MNHHKWYRRDYLICLILAMLATVLIMAACQPATVPEPTPTKPEVPDITVTPEPTRRGGDLRIVWAVDVPLFDPPREARGLGRCAINIVFEGLTEIDIETGKPKPRLATHWTFSDDGLVQTYYLRDDVVFHDGTPFTAEAVVVTAKRWIDPDFPHATRYLVALITDIIAVEDYVVEFHLSAPNPLLPANLGHGMQHIVNPREVTEYGIDIGLHLPSGTGPFRLVEFIPRQSIIMERWDNYWGPEEIHLDRIIWDTVPEDGARTARLLAGEADINLYQSLEDVERVDNTPGLEIVSEIALRQWHFYINTEQPHLADVRVRQALNHAIDQDALVRVAFLGLATPRYSLIGAGHYGAVDVDPVYEYNPEKAIALMEDAGWTRGTDGLLRDKDGHLFEIRLDITTGGVYVQDDPLSETAAGMFEDIGITMKVVRSDRVTFFATTTAADASESNELVALPMAATMQDGAMLLQNAYHEISLMPNCCNWSSVRDKDVWATLDAAAGEVDIERRGQLIEKAQQQIWDIVPVVLLPQTSYIVGKSERVKGIQLSPGELHNLAFAWLEE